MSLGETMHGMLANCGCLILLILFLPLFLILAGPLLVIAALRGRQPAGPIMLDTLRYGFFGRIGTFMLGLALWILVWSGLAWVVINGLLPTSLTTAGTVSTPVIAPANLNPSPPVVERQEQTPTLPLLTATFTPTPLPPPPTPSHTPTVLDITNTPTPRPQLTATPLIRSTELVTHHDTIQATALPSVEITAIVPLTAPLTLADQEDVIATVKEGNRLLREAISLANQENVQNLETVWQGSALTKAQNFVADIYGRYVKPFDVQFEYLILPTVSAQSTMSRAIVTTQEAWTYQGRAAVEREAFEFTYTLNKKNGGWVISRYSYRNLTTSTPTITPDKSAP
ncbi:MAG: hypothetical protein JW953_02210 [Anaerolineae bacterium]|nr:hypothetical protein [Anaerolineae bacterium]